MKEDKQNIVWLTTEQILLASLAIQHEIGLSEDKVYEAIRYGLKEKVDAYEQKIERLNGIYEELQESLKQYAVDKDKQ